MAWRTPSPLDRLPAGDRQVVRGQTNIRPLSSLIAYTANFKILSFNNHSQNVPPHSLLLQCCSLLLGLPPTPFNCTPILAYYRTASYRRLYSSPLRSFGHGCPHGRQRGAGIDLPGTGRRQLAACLDGGEKVTMDIHYAIKQDSDPLQNTASQHHSNIPSPVATQSDLTLATKASCTIS